MDSESNTKYQVAGLKWMFEMELLDPENPAPLNILKLNVLMVSPRIREVEFLIFREGRQMLVLLDLSWVGRKFFKKRIFIEVQEVLKQLLPNFKFRVTADSKIMEMAVDKVKNLLGGVNEIRNKPDPKSDDPDGKSSSPKQSGGPQEGTSDNEGTKTSTPSDSEEQEKSDEGVRDQSGSPDHSNKP